MAILGISATEQLSITSTLVLLCKLFLTVADSIQLTVNCGFRTELGASPVQLVVLYHLFWYSRLSLIWMGPQHSFTFVLIAAELY